MIATLAARDDGPVEVVSGDRDMLALATDRVTVLYTGKGIGQDGGDGAGRGAGQVRRPGRALRRLRRAARRPERRPARRARRRREDGRRARRPVRHDRGDRGRRRSRLDRLPAGAADKILAARDYLAVAPAAVRGRTDVPVPEIDDALPAEPADPERARANWPSELGIEASVNRLRTAIARSARPELAVCA